MAGFGFGVGGKRQNNRRFPGVRGRAPQNYKFRKEEAAERTVAWQKLSHSEQIALLDVRLGKNVGAKKQRARIVGLMEAKHSADKKQ
jgi:hypothetical protein